MTEPQSRQAAAEQLLAQRVLARRRLLYFTKSTHPRYSAGWVHQDICARLERFSAAVAAGMSPRLMLLCPPRSGKSELASIRFPAWHLGQYPHHEVVNAGYNLELPMRFSRKVRELVRDPTYTKLFPDAVIDPDSQGAEAWSLTRGGGFVAVGVSGGLTGKGAHCLLIDDPIKNLEEADNIEVRNKLMEWYQSTAYTRLAPGGGVLLIQCMTGDTPVLLPDGTERRLDTLSAGDAVATFESGRLSTSTVVAWKSSGHDLIHRITTSSGRIVRANGRHPFLVSDNGELKWVRTQNLTTAHKIVALPASGGNGKVSPAQQPGATGQLSVADSAAPTTASRSGPTATGHRRTTQRPVAVYTLSTDTASLQMTTPSYLQPKAANVPSAARGPRQSIGATAFASTTATKLAESADCYATSATCPSASSEQSSSRSPWSSISDFTTERVVSVEPDGEEEVFDVQIARTENFIANGLVSHNTCWSDDDLAGRLQQHMTSDPNADQWEIVKYPALAEAYEWRHRETAHIVRTATNPDPEVNTAEFELLRSPGEALHPERYPVPALHRIRATLDPRIWSALYQQNPVPDEGMYFQKTYFKLARAFPPMQHCRIYTAWDFAIGEKQTNDFTVGATLMQDQTDTLYVLDVHRMKGDTFAIIESVLDVYARWGRIPETDYLLGFEDSQIFRALEPMLKKRMADRAMFPAYETLKPLTDKLARARSLQGRMQHGRVVFLEDARWFAATQQELLRFPAGAHDDIVDALAWAVRLTMDKAPPRPPDGVKLPSWKDRLSQLPSGGTHMSS